MGELARMGGRVTRLEHEMAEVRYLATKAEKDAAEVKTVLIGHTGVLNAIREDQVEQGKKIAKLETEMRGGFADVRAEMHTGFADVRAEMHTGFAELRAEIRDTQDEIRGTQAEMRRGFAVLGDGQARITELLDKHIRESGGGDE